MSDRLRGRVRLLDPCEPVSSRHGWQVDDRARDLGDIDVHRVFDAGLATSRRAIDEARRLRAAGEESVHGELTRRAGVETAAKADLASA